MVEASGLAILLMLAGGTLCSRPPNVTNHHWLVLATTLLSTVERPVDSAAAVMCGCGWPIARLMQYPCWVPSKLQNAVLAVQHSPNGRALVLTLDFTAVV